jgi:hypothetical protein
MPGHRRAKTTGSEMTASTETKDSNSLRQKRSLSIQRSAILLQPGAIAVLRSQNTLFQEAQLNKADKLTSTCGMA